MKFPRWIPPALLAAVALLSLGIGSLVYMADRAPVILMPAFASLAGGPIFGIAGQWLPSFVHPFAFALLTAAVRVRGAAPAYTACWLWWWIDIAFEAGQHPGLREPLAGFVLGTFGDAWPARLASHYFLHGTFDPGDVAAPTLCAMAAAVVLRQVHIMEKRHAH